MKNLSEMEQINIVKGLGGVYHQTRLQVLLDDLGSVDSMYRSMLETADNSEGSAMKENEKYMQSLEAKINLVRVEFEKLIVVVGEAFLTDGMISFLQVAGNVLNTIAVITKTFGALPVIFGASAVTLAILSSRFRDLVMSIWNSVKAIGANDIATKKLSMSTAAYTKLKQSSTAATALNTTTLRTNSAQMAALTRTTQTATVATNTFKNALRGLAIATGAGIAFVAIGYILEKVIGSMGGAIKSSEELTSANKLLMESYSNNQSDIDGLVVRYKNLEEAMKIDPDAETMVEYKDVMNQLGQLLPDLVTGEDQFGNKIIASSTATEIKIGLLKEQLEIQRELNAEIRRAEIEEDIEINTDSLDEAKKGVQDYLKMLTNGLSGTQSKGLSAEFKIDFKDSKGKPAMESVEDLSSMIDQVKTKLSEAKVNGNTKDVSILEGQLSQMERYFGMIQGDFKDVNKDTSILKSNYIDLINSTVSGTDKMSSHVKKYAESFAANMLKISDSSNVTNVGKGLEKVFGDKDASAFVNSLTNEFNKLDSATAETFTSMSTSAQSFIDKLPSSLEKYGLSDIEIKSIQKALQEMLVSAIVDFNKFESEMKSSGKTLVQSRADAQAFAEGVEEAGAGVENLANRMRDANSVYEQMAGVSEKHVSEMEDLLYMYNALTTQLSSYSQEELERIWNTDTLSASEQSLKDVMIKRKDVMNVLAQIYPDLLAKDKEAIALSAEKLKAMEAEEKANKVLLEAYKLDKEGKLNSEQQKTLYAATGTKARIENIKKEILALETYRLALQQVMDDTANLIDNAPDGDSLDALRQESRYFKAESKYKSTGSSLTGKIDELSKYQSELNSSIGGIDSFTSAINKSADKTSKSTKENIYITDKFKQALEAVNLEIEKQQAIQAKHPQHSEKYRKSLEAQLKLEREKLNLIKAQATALDKQIKSGKIAQTGSVSVGDGNSKSSSTKSSKLSGWGTITDTYGTYRSFRNGRMHTGVDLASARGTRLDSNVSGKVTATGKTDLSGNYVKILDDKGMSHFYGHLDKIVAKLGDVVKTGDQIGNVGNTGHSTGSHLHYQINNASGNTFDPMEYVKSAKSMTVSAQQVAGVVSNTTQSIDDAKSTLSGLQGDALASLQNIADYEQAIIESQLSVFDFKRSGYDETLAYEDAKLKNVTVGTDRYTKTLEKQSTLLKAKQRVNNDELAYVEGLIKDGNLSAITLEQMKSRTIALKTSIESLNTEIGRLALDKIYAQYDNYQKKQDNTLDFEKNKLAELDTNSTRYVATLDKINTHLNRKVITTKENIASIEKEIIVSKLQGELLTEAKDKIQALTLEMQNLNQEMSDTNYEIVVNIKTKYDEKVDDLQFEIDRSKVIQGMYKEGSADSANEIKKQIGLYEQMAKAQDESRRNLQSELSQRNLLPERIKEITELMEDETLAYWNSKSAIQALNKELEETNKRMLEDIANELISSYKEYVQERQEEHMKMLDDEMEAEDKAHEKRMKQLSDEMDLFRKNVEEKLKLMDLQEAERDYNMEMDDMETERDKLVDQINLLSLDDSHEAKSKKKKLLEQLDKLDKDITEKRHERDITLQKEALNDLLDAKDEEMQEREDILDEEYQAVVNKLDAKRKYYEKHYNDLLNDERKFAQIREDIMNGHFDKVASEFQSYIQQMRDTMPLLSDTMNGTMASVGTAIRQNVIDNLNEAIKKMNEFNAMQIATNSITDNFNPNSSKDTTYSGNTGSSPSTPSNDNSNNSNSTPKGQVYASLNKGDMQVMLGKYINDIIAPLYKAETADRNALKTEGHRIAGLGRSNSSQIPVSSAFNNELANFTPSQIEQFKGFINSNTSILGGKYASKLTSNVASLNGGGQLNFSGRGVDGIGGKYIVAHDGEVVNTPIEVDKIVNSTSVLENIMKMITPVISKLPSISSFNNPSNQIGNVEINLNGTIQNSNGRDARDLVNDMAQEMRTRGMWR